jgi:hypothetical protein
MRFEFTGLHSATELQTMLRGRELKAEIDFKGGAWFVVTDSRCLAHAAELYKFIYRNGGRA